MNKRTSQIQDQTQLQAYPLTAPGILQRKCACGNHTVAGGGCIECDKKDYGLQRDTVSRGKSGINISLSRIPAIQRKLSIGASDDPLEQEADRIADQVLAASPGSTISGMPPRIQRFTAQPAGQTDTAPASVDRVLASSGKLLEPSLRQDMEQRFGHDFSQVRVHSDTAAEQSAREANANAYTAGNNVVFGAGQFLPGTHDGRRLIAHELTHVIQQSTNGNKNSNNLIQRFKPFRWARCWWGKQENPVVNPMADISTFQSPGASGWRGAKFGCFRDACTRRHRGWDLHAATATPVRAVVTGAMTRHNEPGGFGQFVTLASKNNPKREYRYAHLSQREPAGDYCAGDKLGETGVTGNAQADRPHLHFEVRENGTAVDPAPFLTEPNQVVEATGSAITAIDKTLAAPCEPC